MSSKQEFIAIARIIRPQGRLGEVLADVLTDFPERFAERRQVWIGREDEPAREYALENHWFHKGRVVFKFAGVNSISDAEQFKGMLVQIPRSERAALEAGAVYVSDLIGSTLVDVAVHPNRAIGTVHDVQQGIGAAPLLVVRNGNQEYEIPFTEEHMVRFDSGNKILEMKLPAGLLEVNAPLSDDEKQERRGECLESPPQSPANRRDD